MAAATNDEVDAKTTDTNSSGDATDNVILDNKEETSQKSGKSHGNQIFPSLFLLLVASLSCLRKMWNQLRPGF